MFVSNRITLAHGSGGRLTHELIHDLIIRYLTNPILNKLTDSAMVTCKERLAFTTDSFVVSPLFFPGADIGKLAVCGTVNDLVVAGAQPLYLSLSLIVEEGLEYETLKQVIISVARNSRNAAVKIVTGDFKVVEKGACDKLFINTSGIGRIVSSGELSANNIAITDKIILTGRIAQHGLSVLTKRKGVHLGFSIKSDCNPLNSLIVPILHKIEGIKFMRDPTRGGLATTLNEIAVASGKGIVIQEEKISIAHNVRCACELLGIDPLYIANEGIAVIIVKENDAHKVLRLLRNHFLGRYASVIGEVVRTPRKRVVLHTASGGWRILDMLTGETIPRIC
ncbi:MAG: hydrogenase expression/formation protein HypE [Candidatus Omnitrophica bacterium]|nr:hydrogenase expression/formation protein HypE [Candidatus Omnitrophota bacterium]